MPVLEITEADLIYHAEHMADKAFVSLLFARLAATTDGVTINGMGGGKTIFFRGVDGYLHIPKDSSVCGIPAGDHFVEFSAKKDDATGKFNGDFNSRVEKIDAARRKVCSFVAVQLGQWPDIVSWLEGKKGEGEFREVFAFSAVELAQQINKHPSVLVWALGKLGIDAKGLYDAELWFRKVWPARFPKEVPTQEWFCGGYEEEATGLTKWLMNPPSGELRKLASEARVLSLGFVTHIVEQLREKGEIENRIIYAEQSGATTVDWCSSDRIVMITELSESDTLVKEAIQSGANVLCLCDRSEQGIDHELPVRGSGKLEAVFESAGLNGSEPFDNASLIRQGFAHALKSRFAYRPPDRFAVRDRDCRVQISQSPFAIPPQPNVLPPIRD
ncbi:MAG: hypothetical protein IT205_00355 [Fimbriimonadaceae bacterium]|nr:hypothetical protein [Fimbriimonadaceae bacterium]